MQRRRSTFRLFDSGRALHDPPRFLVATSDRSWGYGAGDRPLSDFPRCAAGRKPLNYIGLALDAPDWLRRSICAQEMQSCFHGRRRVPNLESLRKIGLFINVQMYNRVRSGVLCQSANLDRSRWRHSGAPSEQIEKNENVKDLAKAVGDVFGVYFGRLPY
jgi:hypothetical protein